MSPKKVTVVIFVLAVIMRLLYALNVTHSPLVTDAKEYDTFGLQLSKGKGYVNSSAEPTAYRPPVYPFFLAAIYSIAGHNLTWVRFVQALLGAGICVLTYLIATIIFDNTIATLSGVFCSFYPPLIFSTSQILTETLFTFLLLLGIFLIIERQTYAALITTGIIFGLALLTRPFFIFFLPFLFYWIFINNKFETLKTIPIFIIGVLLILFPWTLRNYYRLDSFVPLANVGGLTLYNSYVVPQKGFGYNSLEGIEDEYYEIKDETERSKYLLGKSIEYIKNNPAKVSKLTFAKLLLFIYPFDGYWYPISFGSKYNIFWGFIFWFCLTGIIINFKDININQKLIYFLFISFLIGIMVFYGSPRFRLPIEPLLICFAVSGIMFLYKKNPYFLSMIVSINILLFVVFRYFKWQEFFQTLRNLL
jgi:4-amino-4-deoxy-L-arabinose transferase-like glycosyltransferase